MDSFNILGGVPVFRRKVSNPRFLMDSASKVADGRPSPPSAKESFPTNILPESDVPAVTIPAFAVISLPDCVLIPENALLSTRIAVATSSMTTRFSVDSTSNRIRCAYLALSHWARVARTAGPLLELRILC